MQASVRFVRGARNPQRRWCVSSARNAGESAICPWRAQPSAEIVRVECAKCRRERDLSGARATLCGARNAGESAIWSVPAQPLRRSCVSSARSAGESATCPVPAQPSAEILRVECAKGRRERNLSRARAYYNFSTRSKLWSWKLRTGDFVVQLEYAEQLGSWKMRSGDFVVQL